LTEVVSRESVLVTKESDGVVGQETTFRKEVGGESGERPKSQPDPRPKDRTLLPRRGDRRFSHRQEPGTNTQNEGRTHDVHENKGREKQMWEEPTMSIKTSDLIWLPHDVYENTRLIITSESAPQSV
jgi:hypothetical protein